MAKFNSGKSQTPRVASSVIQAESEPSGVTYEGGEGHSRDQKSELFFLAVSNFVGENTFYEEAGKRDSRYVALVRDLAVKDPTWTANLLRWLRNEANMRSASIVGAVEYARARADLMKSASTRISRAEQKEVPSARSVVDSVLVRADEPGEMIAYCLSSSGSKRLPMAVKRGINDALIRLYNERDVVKWDSGYSAVRFADVIELTHPVPNTPWKSALYKFLIDRRHGREQYIDELPMLKLNRELTTMDRVKARELVLSNPDVLRDAGLTWEALSGFGVMDKTAWEAIIPRMGYMALLRNLRNFDEAGVSDEVAGLVAAKLSDPEQVARSRQFPYRFWSAYANATGSRWAHALERGLTLSTGNIPEIGGHSLILIDTSASMSSGGYSARSKMTPAQAAALFGIALATRGEKVSVYGFANGIFEHEVGRASSVLREVERFTHRIGEVGHGTEIAKSVRGTFKDQDRVFIFSDMQTFSDYDYGYNYGRNRRAVTDAVPAEVPMYGFNLSGYEKAAMPSGSGNRFEFGGLTDATFKMIPLLEAGKHAAWPWEQ